MKQTVDRVPFFPGGREFETCRDEIMSAVERVYASGDLLQGKPVEAFEHAVAGISGRRFCVAVNSCTDALYFSLVATGVSPGDEVLVPDLSFVASASPILRARAQPVFVDVTDDYCLDVEAAELAVTPRTTAVVFVHLFGYMSDTARLEAFARRHGLVLIEDAAQAFGASRSERPAGALGRASCLSFDPTKTLSAPGSGGAVLTDDSHLAERVRRMRYHGKSQNRGFGELGFNSQMPSATAAVLSVKLKYLDEWRSRRHAVATEYRRRLRSESTVVLPPQHPSSCDAHHKFVIRVKNRDLVADFMDRAGVETRVHYDTPLHAHGVFEEYARGVVSSRAEGFSREMLSLPMHAFLAGGEIDRVVEALHKALRL